MASGDARPIPRKNVAYRVTFPILDADGDLVVGATGLDSEISKDGGTFTDCTNEATQIATDSGMYYLDLTSDEMNADTVAIIVKTTSTGAKTTPIVMYPEEAGDMRADVVMISGDSAAADNLETATDGGSYNLGGGGIVAASVTGNVGGNVVGSVGSVAAGGITASSIATDAIGAAELAADAIAEIADAVWEEALADHSGTAGSTAEALAAAGAAPTAGDIADAVWDEARGDHVGAGSFGEGVASVQGDVDGDVTGNVDGNVGGNVVGSIGSVATGGITAGSIAADAIGASELAADAVAEIADAVWEEQIGDHDGTAGSTAEALAAAAVGTSPSAVADAVWDEARAGHVAGGSFGEGVASVQGDVNGDVTGNVDGSVGSVATGGITAASIATDAVGANEIAASAVTKIADGLLDRDMSVGTDSGTEIIRTVRQALRALRNRFNLAGTTRTVYKEDDSTASWTSTVQTNSAAEPIVGDDPTGP